MSYYNNLHYPNRQSQKLVLYSVTVIGVPPWYVYPRTHVTSDMCTPGRDTQNTEALHPGLLELQRTHGYEEQFLWFYILKFPIQNINGRRSQCNWITIHILTAIAAICVSTLYPLDVLGIHISLNGDRSDMCIPWLTRCRLSIWNQ